MELKELEKLAILKYPENFKLPPKKDIIALLRKTYVEGCLSSLTNHQELSKKILNNFFKQ